MITCSGVASCRNARLSSELEGHGGNLEKVPQEEILQIRTLSKQTLMQQHQSTHMSTTYHDPLSPP